MRYVSTRGKAPELGFEDVLLTGLARDGGLYLPQDWPQFSQPEIARMAGRPYEAVALEVMRPFLEGEVSDHELRAIIAEAYGTFRHRTVAPLVQIGPSDWVLELFHGPTLAFKDIAMQVLARLMDRALQKRGQRATIVGATSGDTGGAAIEAFRGRASIDIFILYPHGRVSDVQRRQMTTAPDTNVHALAVDGTFDDCQNIVKALFNDLALRDRLALAGVNSINWARLMSQIVYYFTSAVALGAPSRKISFTVPTGNFGDIFAGYVAKRMGLPIDRLVIATNRNDILHRTMVTGAHLKEGVAPSISPSMDIQVSSNFERLLFEICDCEGAAVTQFMDALRSQGGFTLPQGALDRLRDEFDSASVTEDETRAQIAATLHDTGHVVCPHTAVGLHAARARRGDPATPMVTLATAHAAKFPDAVEAACGVRPALPPRMADLFERPERVTHVPNDLGAIQALIRQQTGL